MSSYCAVIAVDLCAMFWGFLFNIPLLPLLPLMKFVWGFFGFLAFVNSFLLILFLMLLNVSNMRLSCSLVVIVAFVTVVC